MRLCGSPRFVFYANKNSVFKMRATTAIGPPNKRYLTSPKVDQWAYYHRCPSRAQTTGNFSVNKTREKREFFAILFLKLIRLSNDLKINSSSINLKPIVSCSEYVYYGPILLFLLNSIIPTILTFSSKRCFFFTFF